MDHKDRIEDWEKEWLDKETEELAKLRHKRCEEDYEKNWKNSGFKET